MCVIAIREEAAPELERLAPRFHWVSLGELSRTIEILHRENVRQVVMAGQVKHAKLFSAIRPDWRLAKLLFLLPAKNTDSLIGAVARVLEGEGIRLVDSTKFLAPLLPEAGVLTRRVPDEEEAADIAYGRGIALQIAGLDIGQTVVVRDRACVALEAMEGTDETIERAARLAGGQRVAVVKVSKPGQDMRFDVPVVGLRTVEVMKKANATALAIDAGARSCSTAKNFSGWPMTRALPFRRSPPATPRKMLSRKELPADDRSKNSRRCDWSGRFWAESRSRLARAGRCGTRRGYGPRSAARAARCR